MFTCYIPHCSAGLSGQRCAFSCVLIKLLKQQLWQSLEAGCFSIRASLQQPSRVYILGLWLVSFCALAQIADVYEGCNTEVFVCCIKQCILLCINTERLKLSCRFFHL